MLQTTIIDTDNGFYMELLNDTPDPDTEAEVVARLSYEDCDNLQTTFGRLVKDLSEYYVKPHDDFARNNIRIVWDSPGHEVCEDEDSRQFLVRAETARASTH